MAKFKVNGGFKKVDNSLNGFWKPSAKGEGLQGVVTTRIEGKGADGNPNVFYALRITNAESGPIVGGDDKPIGVEPGMLVGVGGRTLHSFLGENMGREVALVFQGLGRAKRGRNAPKLYECYASEEGGE
jgi:hypothetical protein